MFVAFTLYNTNFEYRRNDYLISERNAAIWSPLLSPNVLANTFNAPVQNSKPVSAVSSGRYDKRRFKMCITIALNRKNRSCAFIYNNSLPILELSEPKDCWTDINEPWLRPEMDVNNNYHIVYENVSSNIEIDDVSGYDFPNTLWIVLPASEIIIQSAIFLPVVLMGIFGNSLLLFIIVKNPQLRSPTNMLIGNMAAADLASLVLYPWLFLISDFFQNYMFGEFGCKMEGWLECSLLLASVMSLSAVSYDRLTAIVLPQETRFTKKSVRVVMICTWIIGSALASPLIFYRTYKERQWKNFLEKYCTENTQILAIYWHVLLTMMVWLPLIIMLICYSTIFIKLDRYQKKVLRREHPLSVSYKTKVFRTLFIVVITFVACRTPFTALIFIRSQLLKINEQNQVDGAFQVIWSVSKYLIFLNATLNPVIYGLMNENFRKAFRATSVSKWMVPKKPKAQTQQKKTNKTLKPRGPYDDGGKLTGSSLWFIFKPKTVTHLCIDTIQTAPKESYKCGNF